jgi:hypothetical protein
MLLFPKKLFSNLLLGAACVILLSSASQQGCNSRKTGAEGPPAPATEVRKPEFLQKKLLQRYKEMDNLRSLTAKARIYSESEGMNISVNANIIWIRDSILWLNAKKFGIEAVRALVTTDSVFVLNRLEKTYTAEALETLRARYNLPEGNAFDIIQRTVLGLPAITDLNNVRSDIAEERHRLWSDNGQYSAEYQIEEGSFLMKNERFIQKRDQSIVSIGFDRHQKIDGTSALFSYLRRVEALSTDTGTQRAEIEFEDIKLNTAPSYRFEIPDHYTKK